MDIKIFYYLSAGAIGGVLAGMGMGGGTLTLPILVLFLGVGQLTAQYANLLAFLPSGSSALLLHVKNGFVKRNCLKYIVPPATVACVAASFFATAANSSALKTLFGGFLVAVAIISLFAKTFSPSK